MTAARHNYRGELEYQPRATQDYIDYLMERWIEFHDIRSIGERAVKETA